MKSAIPKVMHPIAGRPMIDHVLDKLCTKLAQSPQTSRLIDEIHPEIFELFPGYCWGKVICWGIDNRRGLEQGTLFLREIEERVRQDAALADVVGHPKIAAWRQAFSRFGARPSKFQASVEALVRRARRGDVSSWRGPRARGSSAGLPAAIARRRRRKSELAGSEPKTAVSKIRSGDIGEASFGQERNQKVFPDEHGRQGPMTEC